MGKVKWTGWCVAALAIAALAAPAAGEVKFEEGRWRLELSGGYGVDSGGERRQDDLLLLGSLDYEFPVTRRTSLGLRLLPLFVYDQDEHGEDTVWGGGVGLACRIYQHAEEYRGFFGELAANALGHSGRFAGNDSNINFLSSAGLGYQFQSDWHVVLRYQHISNAGLGDENAGANAVVLGLGFSF